MNAEERAAYEEEKKKAQEEAALAPFEPVNQDITQSEWDLMNSRRGQEDAKRLFDIVEQHGQPNIVPDPKPEAAPEEEQA